jgi:hypothetical protein
MKWVGGLLLLECPVFVGMLALAMGLVRWGTADGCPLYIVLGLV